MWAATSLTSGRFGAATISTMDELSERFRALRTRGEGYLEVSRPDRPFPAITLGFRNERAVVHAQYSEESIALLRGDDSVAADDEVDVLIIADLMPFTGEVVMRLDHAWQLVQQFLRTGQVGDHEDWFQT
jgi:hypothetical protein